MKSDSFRNRRSWLISAAVALLIGAWLLSGRFDREHADPAPGAATPESAREASSVRVRTQSAEQVQRSISVNGKTAPARVVQLSAETDGRVVEIGAPRGSNVASGSLIVGFDARDRHARLAEAVATVTQREVEYAGRRKLVSSSYVSEAQLKEAEAALEAAKAERLRAELDIDYMGVRAPFDGALSERLVEQGDFVKRGDPVATFVDNRTIIVSANLSEFDAQHVDVGVRAEARLATGQTVHGRIRYVAPVADEATRTFAVELEVNNADGRLRAGGTAELRIPVETVLAHRISPALLTLDDAGNVGVKIVDDAGRVEFVVADIALATNDGVWVAGLPPTATIITVGQGFVPSGAVVRAVPESDVDTAVAIRPEAD